MVRGQPLNASQGCAPGHPPRAHPWTPPRGVLLETPQGCTPAVFQGWFCKPRNSNNVGYKLECDTCLDRGQIRTYEGESSRSARIRGAEHLADLEKKRPKSVLLKHKLNEHIDEEMRIRMEITR